LPVIPNRPCATKKITDLKQKRCILINLSTLFIVFNSLSCGLTSNKNVIVEKKVTDSVGTIYEFDTTQYFKHKSGFYLSRTQEVFQLNTVTYDDSTGFWSTHYWLDSLMFFGEYPNKRPLKEIIDLVTFISDTASRFEKDKKHVYYARAASDGVYRFIVDKADPRTFQSISDRYGKDKSNIYYGSEIIKNADLKTFKVLNDQDSAKDKIHLYYLGEKIE
jgi:hypothetical protein